MPGVPFKLSYWKTCEDSAVSLLNSANSVCCFFTAGGTSGHLLPRPPAVPGLLKVNGLRSATPAIAAAPSHPACQATRTTSHPLDSRHVPY